MTHERFQDAWGPRARALCNVPLVLRLAWDSGPGLAAAGIGCRVANALLPLAMLWVAKGILDAVQVRFTAGSLRPDFWWLVGLECGLAILSTVLGRASGFCDSLLADRFARHVSVRVMEHAARLDLATHESPAFHDMLDRARAQATDRIAMVHALGSIVQQVVTVSTMAISIAVFSPWLLLLMVVAVVPAFVGESHFAFLGYSLNIEQTSTRRRLDYLRHVGASHESAKELKLFGLAPFVTNEFARLSDEVYEQNVALARRRLVAGVLLSALSTGSYYGAYAYVIYRTINGDLSWGSLQFLAGALAGASTGIQSLFCTISLVADQALFLTDLVQFLGVRPQIESKPHAIPAPRPMREGLVFEDVSFSYPSSSRLVLDRVNLRIGLGERIALVGANGRGKTTLVKLLVRLYDPTAGRILLDGVDLRDYCVEDLHRVIGVIFQDFMRYDLTARQNIAVGRMDREARGDEIELAARQSLADSVVARLPLGYEQPLGRRFEGGVELSGGEWQKVALARAYLRDAQLLVLDEPTAALDARSEHEVFQRFADLTPGRTSLLISHRFSTVRMADRIVVLADGSVAEQGSHHELLARRGHYAGLFELQAASYR